MPSELLQRTDCGLFCPAGGFFIDPWEPVDRAVITHAHADHARPGSREYLAAKPGVGVLRYRMGHDANIQSLDYGESIDVNGVRLSLHPAGHVLGSAQVRLEHRGEVCVVSGDYKVELDPTCTAFEPIRCDLFVSESTFGLPIYRWRSEREIFAAINAWWRANLDAGEASMLFAYALGKAQRLLAGLDPAIGPIYTHGAVERLTQVYRDAGVALPETRSAIDMPKGTTWAGAMIVAPPSAQGSPWLRRFGGPSTGYLSGWMQVRGFRRRRAVDRGFVLSDHADWPGLQSAIAATGAERVWVTHGYSDALARWLTEHGIEATTVRTQFEGERDDMLDEPEEAA
ncbi:MAG: ligase-associated DNA damage response exonuclease [Gemmataceae bacterium]